MQTMTRPDQTNPVAEQRYHTTTMETYHGDVRFLWGDIFVLRYANYCSSRHDGFQLCGNAQNNRMQGSIAGLRVNE